MMTKYSETWQQLTGEINEVKAVLAHLSRANFPCNSVQALLQKRYQEIMNELYDLQKVIREDDELVSVYCVGGY